MKKNTGDIYIKLHAKAFCLHVSSICESKNEHGGCEDGSDRTGKNGIVYIINTQ